MATVASILGQSGFDIDGTDRSIQSGSDSATRSDSERASGSQNDDSATTPRDASVGSENRTVNPADATRGINDSDDNSSRNSSRRRSSASSSRGSGSDKRTRANKDEEGEIHLDALLQSVHGILARLMAAPELELEAMEAKALASAIKRVTKYITKKVLSPQQEAIGALIVTLGAIYLPRYLMYCARTGGPVVDVEPIRTVNVNVS